LDAYQTRCAVTGQRARPVLEAAHIKPFALTGPNTRSNGLALRADVHQLFDLGYVTVDPDCQRRSNVDPPVGRLTLDSPWFVHSGLSLWVRMSPLFLFSLSR